MSRRVKLNVAATFAVISTFFAMLAEEPYLFAFSALVWISCDIRGVRQ